MTGESIVFIDGVTGPFESERALIDEAALGIPFDSSEVSDLLKEVAQARTGAIVVHDGEWGVFFEDDETGKRYVTFEDGTSAPTEVIDYERRNRLGRVGGALAGVALASAGVLFMLSDPIEGQRPHLEAPVSVTAPKALMDDTDSTRPPLSPSDAEAQATAGVASQSLAEPDSVPVFGDGIPDSTLEGPNGVHSYEFQDSNYTFSVDCEIGDTVTVGPGDTVYDMSKIYFPGVSEFSLNRIFPAYKDLLLSDGYLENVDEIQPGDRLPIFSGDCVMTNFHVGSSHSDYEGQVVHVVQTHMQSGDHSIAYEWWLSREGELTLSGQ